MPDIVLPATIEVGVPVLPTAGGQVVVGPPGPPGAGAVAHVHTQATSSASWLITHSLPTPHPGVRVVVDNELVLTTTEYPSATQVALTFATPTAGTAVLTS